MYPDNAIFFVQTPIIAAFILWDRCCIVRIIKTLQIRDFIHLTRIIKQFTYKRRFHYEAVSGKISQRV